MSVPQERRSGAPRIMLLITRAEEERRLETLLEQLRMPILLQCRGRGTAPSEMLDIFGLSGTARQLTAGLLPREDVPEALGLVRRHLGVHRRGQGIALTLPVTGLQAPVLQMLEEEKHRERPETAEEEREGEMRTVQEKTEYALIWTAVASGFGEDVMDAARSAGAKGGTVLKGLRRTDRQAAQPLGFGAQEGQEFVMIVTPREKKAAIMSAICEACGLRSGAHGLVLSLPVEEAVGLEG